MMLIFIWCESLEMMLDKKFVNKFPIVYLIHRQIPNSRDEQTQNHSPNQAEKKFARRKFARKHIIKRDDGERKNNADETFGEQSDADEKVENDRR